MTKQKINRETTNETDHIKNYQKLVVSARYLVEKMEDQKVKIARLCVRACYIQIGGHRAKGGGAKFYTLSQFAVDVGLNRKTLSDWVDTYRKVCSKFPTDKSWNEDDFKAASKIKKRIKGGENKAMVSKLLTEERDGPSPHTRFERIKKNTCYFWFSLRQDKFKKISKSEIKWLKDDLSKMIESLNEVLGDR